MINLSQGLGKRVLAEGVENKDQLNVLRNLGCDAVQGYFIDKPLPEEKLVTYLTRRGVKLSTLLPFPLKINNVLASSCVKTVGIVICAAISEPK